MRRLLAMQAKDHEVGIDLRRDPGWCVTYMSIPLMLGVCDCGCRFNYRIGGERVEIGEAMVWRGVFAEMLMQVVSCCIQLRLARSLIMCCSPDFET